MATMSSTGHPAYDTVTEVRFGDTGSARVCWVAASDARRLVLAAPADGGQPLPAPRPGDRASVMWMGHEGLRALPVELVGVQPALVPLWHFRRTGPEVPAQRRSSVRVDLHVPIQVTDNGRPMAGTTLDLSEGGVRCQVEAAGPILPRRGDVFPVALFLDADRDPFSARGELIRSKPAIGDELRLTLRFVGLGDGELDRLRARVFLELRTQRARGLL
jgi:hypothetical protein